MPTYEDLEGFAKAVHRELPSEWDTHFDPSTVGEGSAGFQRDDLTGFLLQHKVSDDWPPETLHAIIPHEAGTEVPDRPGAGSTCDVDPYDVSATVQVIVEEMPEYQGTFEYED